MSLISIIVPVYKVEQYLDKCIQSIADQTYKNLEIILIDDGSPDRCPEICDEWARKDDRIRVIHQKNAGVAAARNAGLDIAKGDYIGFVDSDDYIAKDMYEQLLCALKKSDKKIANCSFCRVGNDDGDIDYKTVLDDVNIENLNVKQSIKKIFYREISCAIWCKLYEKTALENFRFNDGEVSEEYPLHIPSIVRSGGMVHVHKNMYFYRKRAESLTGGGHVNFNNAIFIYKNLQLMKKQLQENEIHCNLSFLFFSASNAYGMALVFEKNKDILNESNQEIYKKFRAIMLKNFVIYMCSRYSSLKLKVFYLLVLTRTLRPLYKLLGKSL